MSIEDVKRNDFEASIVASKRKEIPVFDSMQSKSFFEGLANACYNVPRMQNDLSVD